jgi:hypothetical protein
MPKKSKKNIESLTNTEYSNTDEEMSEDVTQDKDLEATVEEKIINCVKNCNIFDDTTNKSKVNSKYVSKYLTEKDYQNSFNDVMSFSKSLTEKERKSIDVVMYHENNNDGLISAYITWLFYKEKNNSSNKLPIFIPSKPSSSNNMLNFRIKKHEDILKNKVLLILDISFPKIIKSK